MIYTWCHTYDSRSLFSLSFIIYVVIDALTKIQGHTQFGAELKYSFVTFLEPVFFTLHSRTHYQFGGVTNIVFIEKFHYLNW